MKGKTVKLKFDEKTRFVSAKISQEMDCKFSDKCRRLDMSKGETLSMLIEEYVRKE